MLSTGVLALVLTGWIAYGPGLAADEVTDPRTGRPVFRLPRGTVLVMRWFLPALLLLAVLLVVLVPAPR